MRWHVFSGPPDGEDPEASLILGSDGNLYGTTFSGGSGSAGGGGFAGTIFKLTPTIPHTLTVLHTFRSSGTQAVSPSAPLLQAQDGNFYGTTTFRANTAAGGTIFQMTPKGRVTFVYTFPDGEIPEAPLIQATDGNFYGASGQIVFKMTPDFVVSTLHTFGQGTDGAGPKGVVLGPNGNLYGVTSRGGTADRGTVFELSTDGASYTVLHNFSDGSVPNDGEFPNGPLVVGTDNNLYGTTEVGGSANFGTIFRVSP